MTRDEAIRRAEELAKQGRPLGNLVKNCPDAIRKPAESAYDKAAKK
jgi:hypothetical protein